MDKKFTTCLLFLLVFASALMPHGTAVSLEPVESARLKQLTPDELRAILPGSILSVINRPHDYAGDQFFGCRGEWSRFGGRISASGRYSLRANGYCLERGNSVRSCFNVFSDNGKLYLQSADAGVSKNFVPIEIDRCPNDRTCPQTLQGCGR
jgi:hypothetical protein